MMNVPLPPPLPTAQTSLAASAETARRSPRGVLGMAVHCLPSQCSISAGKTPEQPWKTLPPTAQMLVGETAAMPKSARSSSGTGSGFDAGRGTRLHLAPSQCLIAQPVPTAQTLVAEGAALAQSVSPY